MAFKGIYILKIKTTLILLLRTTTYSHILIMHLDEGFMGFSASHLKASWNSGIFM